MKKLGVIILNWNGIELLKEFLPTASKHTTSDEADLIVADNGSTDGSVDWIRENHPEVKVLELGENYGFAEGYNRAVAALDYPYVVLLNSDVEVTPDWWRPLLDLLEKNPGIGAVQPKILSYKDRGAFEYAGAAGGYIDALGYPWCRGRLFDRLERDEGQYDGAPVEVAWASGACLAMPSELYRRSGGLDTRFFAHMEEIDLCVRIRRAGLKVVAISDSAVYHVGGASLNQGNPKKTYLNFRNNLLLLHKNLPRRKGKRILLLRRLADTLAFGMNLLKGDVPNAKAILKAHSDFRKMRKEYRDLPAEDIFPQLPGTDRYAVTARYLLGKKTLEPKKENYL